MGCTVPKPPKFKSIYVPETNFPVTPRLPHDIALPTWVEVPENYYVASCRMQTYRNSYAVVVVFWGKPNSLKEWDRGYAKVYVYDDDKMRPFPQMKGIIQEIRKRKLNYSSKSFYEISEDGEIRESITKDIPSNDTLREVAVLMMELHERWRDYPNIDNFDMVEKLEKAKDSIRRMNDEETYGYTKNRIEKIRASIKEEQEQISQIERGLNSMYEEAADAMNLLEENGIDPNHFDDKPEEEVKPTVEQLQHMVDCLNNRLGGMPGDSIRYIGIADIKKLGNGSTIVQPMNITANPEAGDIVLDPKTGHTAMLDSYGNWQVVSS